MAGRRHQNGEARWFRPAQPDDSLPTPHHQKRPRSAVLRSEDRVALGDQVAPSANQHVVMLKCHRNELHAIEVTAFATERHRGSRVETTCPRDPRDTCVPSVDDQERLHHP